MTWNSFELHAAKITEYLVKVHHYQVVKVKQATTDIWLVNAKHKQYPIIRVSAVVEDIEYKQLYLRQVHRTLLDFFHREANLLLINTNSESVPLENTYMKQICVDKQGISDQKILKEFPQLDQCYSEYEDKKEELARITRVIEEEQMKKRTQFIKDRKRHLYPVITYCLLAIFTSMFIMGNVFGIILEDTLSGWMVTGIYYKMNVVAAYEYWRLVTAGFIHIDPFTFLITCYAMVKVGKIVEPLYSKLAFLIIFLSGIIVGNLCMLIAVENTIGYGAGAGICSLIGGYFALTIESRRRWRTVYKYFQFSMLMLVLVLLPSISILGHFVSFISGYFMMFIWKNKNHVAYRHIQVSTVIMYVGLVVLGMHIQRIEPLEPVVDERIVKSYQKLGIQQYANYLEMKYKYQYDLQK